MGHTTGHCAGRHDSRHRALAICCCAPSDRMTYLVGCHTNDEVVRELTAGRAEACVCSGSEDAVSKLTGDYTMLTNLKVAMIIMAVLFAMMGVSFAFQIYGLQVQVDALTVQIDGMKRSIDQKK
jgi:hypothetical protein